MNEKKWTYHSISEGLGGLLGTKKCPRDRGEVAKNRMGVLACENCGRLDDLSHLEWRKYGLIPRIR